MAFLIFIRDNEEIGRRPLAGPMVVGRSPDCDVSVHDILLSRRHCRIEPAPAGGWEVIDLQSKNGTRMGGESVARRALRDGDILQAGNTTICFRVGDPHATPAAPAAAQVEPVRLGKRPADPFEALAGTVSGFDAIAAMNEQQRLNLPVPKPLPRDPAAYVREDVYAMLTEIASSSWDSIYATASRPNRPLARVAGQPHSPAGPRDTAARLVGATTPARRPAPPYLDNRRPHAVAYESTGHRAAAPVSSEPVPLPSRIGWLRALARSAGRAMESVRRRVAPHGAVRLL